MNNKIEELKKQCYISVADRNGDNEYDMEKFAKLIVQACSDFVFKYAPSEVSAIDLSLGLEEHFGVKDWSEYFGDKK